MIDLRERGLPHHIEVDGVRYELETDFRKWIEFDHALREDRMLSYCIFKGKPPEGTGWAAEALAFMESRNVTPREVGSHSRDRIIDMVLDGDYIVASFQQAYGIDLTSVDYMHWHRFKALLGGLPDDTKMGKVMGYRAWKRDSRKPDDIMREQKQRWRLPEDGEQQAIEEARRIAELTYEQEVESG